MEKVSPWVGVGLRHPHHDHFLNHSPDIGWLEIHSENFFLPHSNAFKALHELRRQYAISCHGVGLSLGSVDPVNKMHLAQLKRLVDCINPLFVSDHLSWSSVNGEYFNDLLPLPYTEEALEVFCRNVDITQDYLNRQILVENPSSYLGFSHSTIPEWEFLADVVRRTGCGLLLDLNNVHVSAFNHGFDSDTYLAAINPEWVQEIHLAGFTIKQLDQGEIWIDTHSQPVSEPVWAMYKTWVAEHGPRHTLIEWDRDIPEPEVLLAEAAKADCIIKALREPVEEAS
ncbi:DUF692 domain-containing protein [Grimontia hollisae]|uniref:UPF0276 protein VHA_000181 n=2 Tax=Grimontia hollisae TaxID=673 RepID=D0I350_GRIHO|nr:DUF692 domain-containing protein [Grimontia hollisae]AMG30688.1 DUF692 domain-containing protein [Grimontia hollisae]EEY74092.1 hypothetical protein VHA_000181 [Grimontia hollisae CIP 101886]MDF2184839.1 DUF692 domain-containing protein [Grimontia hollisae]STO47626.1 Protein of uncharacterised function (DUF692) [Grimontia hollisae]STO58485.1 Protein of uncharacterised function (DUF692) [Grimontia hollisae]